MSNYLNEVRKRAFCGKCEAGIEHSREECEKASTSEEVSR